MEGFVFGVDCAMDGLGRCHEVNLGKLLRLTPSILFHAKIWHATIMRVQLES